MNEAFKNRHPIALIKHYAKILHREAECEFAHYLYEKQSTVDKRTIVRCKINEAEDFFLNDSLMSISKNYDIALQSRVYIKNDIYHIPMCDFTGDINDEKMLIVFDSLKPLDICDVVVYFSGNSYHGYGLTLIKDSDYYNYLGRLLLCNLPRKSKIIDDRWVGHRLISGYLSLRLTYNQQKYRKRKLYYYNEYSYDRIKKLLKK
jgi:hypothetical protein